MITSLRLVDWKSFSDATLYIDALTILIGANASGKSNLLDALEFLRRIGSGISIEQALAGGEHGGLPPLRGGTNWAMRKGSDSFRIEVNGEFGTKKYTYALQVLSDSDTIFIYDESLSIEGENKFRFKLLNHAAETYEVHDLNDVMITGDIKVALVSQLDSKSIQKNLSSELTAIKEDLVSLFPFKPLPDRMRVISPLSNEYRFDASNLAGFLAKHENKKAIEKELTNYARKIPEGDFLSVWAEVIGRTKERAELYCKEQWSPKEKASIVDATNMSDGTLRFIAIVVAILTAKPGSLVAIEEIDNGLHPSRAELLVRTLREIGARRKVDILAVTHNPALLNALGPESVPFISVLHREKSGASTITLLEDIHNLPKLMASGPLGTVVTQGKLQKALRAEEQ